MNKTKGIILMLVCTIFTAIAQILYKIGAARLEFNIIGLITNWPLILGFASYGIALVFMLLAYKHAQLTLLYPIIAATYIWVTIAATAIFPDESLTMYNVIGIFLIITGITAIGKGT